MATHYQSGSWNSSSILQGYGLMAVIGAYEPTPADVKRLNSRSGGEHAGHGNWMQTFNPKPVIKNGPATKVYEYAPGSDVVIQSRLPGLPKRKVTKFRGFKRTPVDYSKLGAQRDIDGVQETVKPAETVKPVIDTILEKNRTETDASMESQTSVSPKSTTTYTSPVSDMRMEEIDPNVQMDSSSSSDKKIGPNPALFVSTTNYADARNITNQIYKRTGRQGAIPMEVDKVRVQKNRRKGEQKVSSSMDLDSL